MPIIITTNGGVKGYAVVAAVYDRRCLFQANGNASISP
jgi:hypothetical protein